jgi:hypothetical protein
MDICGALCSILAVLQPGAGMAQRFDWVDAQILHVLAYQIATPPQSRPDLFIKGSWVGVTAIANNSSQYGQ